jgi:hypothetical protein
MQQTRQDLAAKCDQIIRECAKVMHQASIRIGWYGLVLKKQKLFHELGFADEEAYYTSCGIGRSTWFRALQIAENLKGIQEEKVLAMKVENAVMLARAPEPIRHNPEVVQSAISEPCRNFSHTLRSKEPTVRLGAIKVRRVELFVEMGPRERREINEAINAWMQVHHVVDRGEALLQMVRAANETLESSQAA